MRRSTIRVLVAVCVAGYAWSLYAADPQQAPVRLNADTTTEGRVRLQPDQNYRDTVTKYCVTCHNERLKTGDLMLDTIVGDDVAAHADVWEKVIRKSGRA